MEVKRPDKGIVVPRDSVSDNGIVLEDILYRLRFVGDNWT